MQTILTVVHVVLAIALIALVLLQHGKGADAGAAFGSGASATVFGARGSGSFLTRSTSIIATLFFLTSMALAYFAAKVGEPSGLMDGIDLPTPLTNPTRLPPGASDVPTTDMAPALSPDLSPDLPPVVTPPTVGASESDLPPGVTPPTVGAFESDLPPVVAPPTAGAFESDEPIVSFDAGADAERPAEADLPGDGAAVGAGAAAPTGAPESGASKSGAPESGMAPGGDLPVPQAAGREAGDGAAGLGEGTARD